MRLSTAMSFCVMTAISSASALGQVGTSTTGNSIGINFGADEVAIAATQNAGVFAQQNWANAFDGVTAGAGSLTNVNQNNAGAASATTADVTWMNFETILGGDHNFGTTIPGDNGTMMTAGHFIRSGVDESIVSVNEIPYEVYDVYVYSQQGASGTARDSLFSIGGNDVFLETINSAVFEEATGTSTADPNSQGNFILFSGLTGPSFTLDVTGLSGGSGLNQSALQGLQIVDQTVVPEPTSVAIWSLAGLGSLAFYGWRRHLG